MGRTKWGALDVETNPFRAAPNSVARNAFPCWWYVFSYYLLSGRAKNMQLRNRFAILSKIVSTVRTKRCARIMAAGVTGLGVAGRMKPASAVIR